MDTASRALSIQMPAKRVKRRDVHRGDRIFFYTLRGIGILVLLLVSAIVLQLVQLSLPALAKFGIGFLAGTDWNPVSESFGAAPFVFGTLVSSFVALLISVPIAVGSALYLNELAHPRLAGPLGFLVEMLAAIPSVVYGLWGIFVLAPSLRSSVQPWLKLQFGKLPGIGFLFQGPAYGYGMLCASVVLAIMITPTICAICREVFRAVPLSQREAALALGATRWEMLNISVAKASMPGVIGAIILGLGRALGETMAVTMVIGNRAVISASLFATGQTMASVIANEYPEVRSDIHLSSLAAIGLALFVVSTIVNGLARVIVWKFSTPGGRR